MPEVVHMNPDDDLTGFEMMRVQYDMMRVTFQEYMEGLQRYLALSENITTLRWEN
jgi:hypothetical protein